MRLEEMKPAHVRRAVELYLQRAWPPESPVRPRIGVKELQGAATMEELFARFELAPRDQVDGFLRYTLRLGNHRYPFMKFVVQEYLVDEEFFFTVDTHDNLEVRPSAPDFAQWQELKRYNRELKERIECEWRTAGLPTFEDLRAICEGLAPVEREGIKRKRLLLVDDEMSIAIGLGALLKARGYDVELAYSGEQVLERLAHEPLPDLLLLDYELPELDGQEVLDRVRNDPRLADLPVLMATASSIELSRLRRVSGFLRKPYSREVLFTMLRQLLDAAPGASAGS